MVGAYQVTDVVLPAVARAADTPTLDVEAGINALVPFVDGMATVGKLGQPLPGLDLRPGAPDALDVATALSATFTDAGGPLGGNYGGASTLDELASKLNAVSKATLPGSPGGRTVTITASHPAPVNGVDTIPLTVAIDRADAPTGFAIATNGFTFNSAGGLHTHLTMNLGLTINYRSSDRALWLSFGGGTPSLTVATSTTMPTPGSVDAAIGILKVKLGDDSTLTNVTDNFATTFSDPSNDGRLDLSEYSAAGSSAGLASVDWATSPASNFQASLHLTADPTGISGDLSAADATVAIGPLDPSKSPLSSTVTGGSLASFDAFQRLSPKDLADSLAEFEQFLISSQMTHLPAPMFNNIPLPFMKGALADAAQVSEAIDAFLKAHVPQIPTDPSTGSKTVGKPDFASIQDLIGKLNTQASLPGGATFSVTGTNYDATAGHEKLTFDVAIERKPGASPQDLDRPGTPTVYDGVGIVYGPKSVVLPVGKKFDPSFTGRAITAGTLTAAILDISADGRTADLDPAPLTPPGGSAPSSDWKGVTADLQFPKDGTPLSVAAADPQTGEAQLADVLKSTTGLVNANAQLPIATVTPSYKVDLPVVLDLSPPTSSTPTTVTNPDGSKTVVASLPTPPQRLKLHTGGTGDKALVALDVPITSEVHASATVGFLGVRLDGTLAECTAGTYNSTSHACNALGSTHLLEIDLLAPTSAPLADGDGNISLPDFFAHLVSPDPQVPPEPEQVLSAQVHGEAHATLTLSVPDAPSFFPNAVTLSVDMANVTNPTAVQVTGPDPSQLTGLKAFDISGTDPKALFHALLMALGGVDNLASQLGGSSGALHDALATPIPLLGGSVKNLVGGSVSGGDGVTYGDDGTSAHNATVTDPRQNFSQADSKQLAGRTLTAGTTSGLIASASGHVITLAGPWAGANAAAKPADGTPYSVADELKGVVDLLTATSADSLQQVVELLNDRLGSGSGVTFSLDASGTPAKLRLSIDWKRSYTTTQPVVLDLGSFNLAGAHAHGTATFGVDGEVKVGLVVPLTAAAMGDPLGALTIDPSSKVSVKATADLGTGTFVEANAGPLAISLGDPSHPQATNLEAKAALGVALTDTTDTDPVSLSDFAGHLSVALNQGVDPVSCTNAPTVDSDHYAICAALPVYTSADGTTWTLVGGGTTPDATNSILLRLPQSTGTDLGAQFDTSGKLGDGTTDKLAIPADLTTAIASSFLDLSSLDDGLLGYLTFAEQSLRLASAGGKLPLVGKDLQQGANFIGNIRTQIDNILGPTALPNGKLPTVQDVQNKLTDLGNALHNAGVLPPVSPTTFHIELTCSGAPCTPIESAADISGITVTTDLGQGDPSNPAGNGALTATVPLDVGVPGLSFHSTGDGSGTTGLTATLAWSLHLKFGLSRDRGFFVNTQDHDPSSPAGKSGPEFKVGVSVDVSNLSAQLAFLNVTMQKNTTTNDPKFAGKKLFAGAFSVDLKSGASAADCSDASCNADDNEFLDLAALQSGTNITDFVTPLLSAEAAIDWNIRADVDSALPGIGAEFQLHWGWTSANPDGSVLPDVLKFKDVTLDPGQFINKVLGPLFKQIADALKPLQPIIDTINAPIPVLSDLSKAVGGSDITIASLAEEFSTLAGGPDIAPFIDVLTNINDVVKKLTSGTCPGGGDFCINVGTFDLSPQIATTQTNTPDLATTPGFISNASTGDPLTDLANDSNDSGFGNTSGTGDSQCTDPYDSNACTHPGLTFPALKDPTQLFQLLLGHDVTLAAFDSGPLSLGFSLSEEFGPVYAPPPVDIVISGSAGVTLRVSAGFDTYGIRKAVEEKKATIGILDSLFFATNDKSGKPQAVVSFTGSIAAGAEVTAFILKAGVEGGITLTVNFFWNDPDNDGKFRFSEFLATALNNPICLFNVGGELDVFLKVFITIGFSPFDVSFDFTLVNVKLLDFSLKPDCNPPPPRLGGVSGSTLYIYAGKLATDPVRGSPWGEKLGDESWVIRQNGDGSVTVNGLGIAHTFGVNPSTTINTVVFDGRGYTAGKFSVLFQGAAKGQPFTKTAVVFGGNGDDNIRTGAGTSYVDGGPGNDNITTGDRPDPGAEDAATAKKAFVAGGPGNDVITTGNAQDWVAGDSALSASQISPSAPGYDTKKTDTTDNAPVGTVPLANTIDPASVQNPATPAENLNANDANHDGDDLITVGIGGSTVWGDGGKDKIGTAQASTVADVNPGNARYTAGPNTIIGGSGSDLIASGSADDNIYTGSTKTQIGEDQQGPDDNDLNGSPAINAVDTGTGADTVYGSKAEDDVTTHSAPLKGATVFAGGGNDIVDGGDGPDALFGGPGDDYLISQPATVDKSKAQVDALGTPAYLVTNLPDTNPAVSKTLVGGGGSDRIYGGDGPSTIFGDHSTFYDANNVTNLGTDLCASPGPAASDPPAEHPNPGVTPGSGSPGQSDPDQQDKADLILGGSAVDTIQAGGGNDIVNANGGNDVVCGESGADTIDGGGDSDTVWGGTGNDLVFGGGGTDSLYGNLNDDTVYGGAADDVVEGNDGMDTLNGGPGNDTVVGGTQVAGRVDTDTNGPNNTAVGDTLYGDIGHDLLIGDNGQPAATDSPAGLRVGVVDDLDNTHPAYGAGDHLYGGDNEDSAYGGIGNDVVDGGNADDYLEGNPGADHMTGDAGQDDIIGGSAQAVSGSGLSIAGYPDDGDVISGGDDQDVVVGDNGSILRTGTTGATTVTGTLEDVTKGHTGMTQRRIALYDVGLSSPGGPDTITGDNGDDALFGGAAGDTINGNSGDDYVEGDQGADTLHGDAGQDDILGGGALVASGSADAQTAVGEPDVGDTITGDVAGQAAGDPDVILGDDGSVLRIGASAPTSISNTPDDAVKGHAGVTARRIRLYDVTDSASSANSGPDDIAGQGGDDAIFGQGDNDRIKGGDDADHLEGGQAADFIEGDAGDDDIVGGSATILSGSADQTAQGVKDGADVLFGGAGNDVATGDNAVVVRVGPANPDANYTTKFTNRLVPGGTGVVATRWLRRLDLSVGNAALLGDPAGRYGGDRISGGQGADTLFGQDGADYISGGPDDDYIEGGGAADVIRGDLTLTAAAPTNVFPPAAPPATADQTVPETTVPALVDNWVGTAGPVTDLEGPAGSDGQDDIIGGSSLQGFRDGNDTIEGDGEADFQLGDNGALVRDFGAPDGNGIRHYTVYTARYPAGAVPANATVVRHNDPTIAGMVSTRFCVSGGTTCEPTGASGNDTMYGDAGDDTMWGQDGNDTMRGGAGNDDMYGELGDDSLYGDGGQDAMLGDRGGIVDTYINASGNPAFAAPYTVSVQAPPAISYTAFRPGTYDRRVDLMHDINGASFVGGGTTNVMPHNGVAEGGNDHLRGGGGHDNIHAGFGDDLANGDSGGDTVFGDDGADVLWGGKGCDPTSAEDFNGTCIDPANDRGTNDSYVDYTFGGKGGTSQISIKGDVGSDIMDWQPRGSYPSSCTTAPWPMTISGGTTIDPCDWFLMTKTYNDTGGTADPSHRDNQTHHGVDWMYGGWDRDVMQADQADEGPNTGDRLLDWNGAYNLYSHCNPAYGGFNDVRQLSPDELTFIQKWSYGVGIGQQLGDVTTAGTSAYDEVAIVYQADMNAHGSGSDYPTTPGHFDSPNACAY